MRVWAGDIMGVIKGYVEVKDGPSSNAQQNTVKFDIAVLDFSKAFDTVPHDGLLSKQHYGIDDIYYNCLKKQETKCRS